MCTYLTQKIILRASGKTSNGWSTLTEATVYFDHPVHFPTLHALMIDVMNPGEGASHRVALEMDAESARDLAAAITRALDAAPADLLK